MGSAQGARAHPGCLTFGWHDQCRPFSLGLTREAAARYSFLLAIPAVLASGLFSLPDAFEPAGEGLNASGPQLLVANRHRLRGRLRSDRVAASICCRSLHVLVRRIQNRSRRSRPCVAGHRGRVRDIGPVSTSTTRPCGHRPLGLWNDSCPTAARAVDVQHCPYPGRSNAGCGNSTTTAGNRPKGVVDRLVGLDIAEIVRSPLLRCEQTVGPIAVDRGLTPWSRIASSRSITATGRVARSRNSWKNRSGKWCSATLPVQCFPGGEGLAQVQARAVAAIREHDARLAEEHGKDVVWIVCSTVTSSNRFSPTRLPMHLDSFPAHRRRARLGQCDSLHGDTAVRSSRQRHQETYSPRSVRRRPRPTVRLPRRSPSPAERSVREL